MGGHHLQANMYMSVMKCQQNLVGPCFCLNGTEHPSQENVTLLNTLWPSDTTWRQGSMSSLTQVSLDHNELIEKQLSMIDERLIILH